ncbi:MAG TPA: DNA gyrase modulator, partial [Chthoniobacterales bacterium]|nr:DNA gyrase modulator [Chthoniobacterales bacterium]
MNRRKFIKYTGLTTGLLLVPPWARSFDAIGQTAPVPDSEKKKLADVALNAATKKGAKYVDVRIGRYLNQSIFTREDRVENIVSGESYGAGVRVIADGAWGFAATDNVTPDAIAKAAEQAVAIAKANAKLQDAPVVLAPQKGVGELAWRTPIVKNAFEVPVADKVALLMEVNKAALANGANFINSNLFQINEQKYFASTDGSYIDQDVHRIWPTFNVTGIDPKGGRFQTRQALGTPCGRGWEYMAGAETGKRGG